MVTAAERIGLYNGEDYHPEDNRYGFGAGGHAKVPAGNTYPNYIQAVLDAIEVYGTVYSNTSGSTVNPSGAGPFTFEVAIARDYVVDTFVHIGSSMNSDYVFGRITDWDSENMELTVEKIKGVGSSPLSSWNITGPAGPQGEAGANGTDGTDGEDSSLVNTIIVTPQEGDFLYFNGAAWVNVSYIDLYVDYFQERNVILQSIADLSTTGIIVRKNSVATDVRTITGTANQITVLNGGGVSGNPTLSLPQDIATTSNVEFGTLKASTKIVDVTGTSKTLALTDAGTLQACSNASPQAITIPTNASVAFPVGTVIAFDQAGAGLVTVTGDTGVTVNGVSAGSKACAGQYKGLYIRKTATNTWIAVG